MNKEEIAHFPGLSFKWLSELTSSERMEVRKKLGILRLGQFAEGIVVLEKKAPIALFGAYKSRFKRVPRKLIVSPAFGQYRWASKVIESCNAKLAERAKALEGRPPRRFGGLRNLAKKLRPKNWRRKRV